MSDNKNEMNINVSGSHDVILKNISQTLNNSEKTTVEKEISELLSILRLPPEERQRLTLKLEEAKEAVATDQPKSKLSKILGEAGSFLKEFALEAGKTAISALIKGGA